MYVPPWYYNVLLTIALYLQEDSTLPEPEILYTRILESHEVYESGG